MPPKKRFVKKNPFDSLKPKPLQTTGYKNALGKRVRWKTSTVQLAQIWYNRLMQEMGHAPTPKDVDAYVKKLLKKKPSPQVLRIMNELNRRTNEEKDEEME